MLAGTQKKTAEFQICETFGRLTLAIEQQTYVLSLLVECVCTFSVKGT